MQRKLNAVAHRLNTRSRKCLHFATPLEVYAHLRHHSPFELETALLKVSLLYEVWPTFTPGESSGYVSLSNSGIFHRRSSPRSHGMIAWIIPG